MEPQQPNLNELISGMLDGELTNAEARRLDAEMKANPALQRRMDELALLRRSLLSGRPTGRLPKSFAARITHLAKERADHLGDEAPEWLQSDINATQSNSTQKNSTQRNSTQRNRFGRISPSDSLSEVPPSEYKNRAWIPIASICSAICIAGLVFVFRLSDPEAKPIANLPPFQQSEDVNTASAEELLQSQSTVIEPIPSVAKNEGAAQERSVDSSEIALIPPLKNDQDGLAKSTLEKVDVNEPTIQADSAAPPDIKGQSDSRVASNEMKKSTLASESEPNGAQNSLAGVSESKSKRSKGSAPIVSTGRLLFAVYVDMDKVAFENNALDQIFAKHGIAAIEELAINEDQLRSLLTTGLAGSVSLEGNSIVLLKGKSKSIDKAVMEINSQYKDFPAIGMNVLMGEEVKELERQFSTISVDSAPASKRLTVKNESGIFSRFSDGKLKAKKMPNNGGLAKIPLVVDDGESLMLLLIREVE
ncbi:MAG: hypothetical protein ACK5RF_11595 [Pirellula sp.]